MFADPISRLISVHLVNFLLRLFNIFWTILRREWWCWTVESMKYLPIRQSAWTLKALYLRGDASEGVRVRGCVWGGTSECKGQTQHTVTKNGVRRYLFMAIPSSSQTNIHRRCLFVFLSVILFCIEITWQQCIPKITSDP